MNTTALEARLIYHEGWRQTPYLDCCGNPWRDCDCPPAKRGNLSIGVGLNLDAGLSDDEVRWLLRVRIARARQDALTFPWFDALDDVRQEAITELVFNMGIARFRGFQNMIMALACGKFAEAASELLNSKYATQVGMRAVNLAKMILSGETTQA